jgi:hypothetical protein
LEEIVIETTRLEASSASDWEGLFEQLEPGRTVKARKGADGGDNSIRAFKDCASEQGVLCAIHGWARREFGATTVRDMAAEIRAPLGMLGLRPALPYVGVLALVLIGLGGLLRGLRRVVGTRAGVWLTPPVAFAVCLSYLDLTLTKGIAWQIAGALVFLPLSVMVLRLSIVGACRKTLQDLTWAMMLMVLVPALAFVCVEALLVTDHVAAVKGISSHDPLLVIKTLMLLVWNMIHAVPLLDATSTLHWNYPFEYTTAVGGGLVVIYKLLFLIPLSHLLALAAARLFGKD